MEVRNVQAVVLGQDGADRLAEKGLHSREELVERVRDTFVPKRDSFEKLKVKDLSGCECYANYQITTPLPKSLFGDSFGYEMQKRGAGAVFQCLLHRDAEVPGTVPSGLGGRGGGQPENHQPGI